MTIASQGAADPSFRSTGIVRDRLRRTKHAAIAKALGKSESWVQKVLENKSGVMLDDILPLLAALSLVTHDAGLGVADPAVFNAYKTLAARALTDPSALSMKGTE